RLEAVEPLVPASDRVVRIAAAAEIPQAPHRLCNLRVIGTDRPTVPERAEVLARVEAERRRVAKAAGPRPVVRGAGRLSGILEQQKATVAGERPKSVDRAR